MVRMKTLYTLWQRIDQTSIMSNLCRHNGSILTIACVECVLFGRFEGRFNFLYRFRFVLTSVTGGRDLILKRAGHARNGLAVPFSCFYGFCNVLSNKNRKSKNRSKAFAAPSQWNWPGKKTSPSTTRKSTKPSIPLAHADTQQSDPSLSMYRSKHSWLIQSITKSRLSHTTIHSLQLVKRKPQLLVGSAISTQQEELRFQLYRVRSHRTISVTSNFVWWDHRHRYPRRRVHTYNHSK
jgi:hypothetical protein